MADRYWTGAAADGNWNNVANWDGGAALPANGTTAIIGSTNQAIIGATVAQTTLTVKFTEGFGGTVGADAPLIFTGATLIQYGGRGSYANFGSVTNAVTAAMFNTSGGQQVVLSSGTWTTATFSGGNVTIAAGTIVTTLNNVGAVITVGYNATQFTTAINCGTLYMSRSVDTLKCKRGTVVQYNNGIANFNTVNTVADIENGATYNKQSGGTDAIVNVYPGGRFTIVGNTGESGGTGVTVTALNIWAGSTVVDVAGGIILTATKAYFGISASGSLSSSGGA